MIGRLLKNTEWSRATDYLSPVFFQVVPTLAMGKKIAKLVSSYSDQDLFEALCTERSRHVKFLGIVIKKSSRIEPKGVLSADDEFKVLTLYFWQLLATDTPCLDLRRASFHVNESDQLLWDPKPLFATFDLEFAQSIRDMYLGFYKTDVTLFDLALSRLNLLHAKGLFLDHFGSSQTSMVFDLVKFRKTFHDLFVSCKENRKRLHPDFLAFGAGLFSLYEHLERNKRPFNVKAAFEQALALTEGVTWLESQSLQ